MNELPSRTTDSTPAPPPSPAIISVWNIDDVKHLPEGAIVIWTDGSYYRERRAAVINDGLNGEKWIQHTNQNTTTTARLT